MAASYSIRLRMTVWFMTIQIAGLILFGVVMCILYRQTLIAGKTKTLQQRSARIEDFLHHSIAQTDREWQEGFSVLTATAGEGLYMRVRDESGTFLFQPQGKPPVAYFPWPAFLKNGSRMYRVSYAGQSYMVLVLADKFRGMPVNILVGGSMHGPDALLLNFAEDLAVAGAVLIFFAAIGTWTASQRALRPVDTLTRATREISMTDLSARLPVPNTGDELERLARMWNDLIGRLETSSAGLKRFTADASHELRSPIAMVAATTEHVLMNCDISSDVRGNLEMIYEECQDATRLLENMLYLARTDAGVSRKGSAQINLVPCIEQAYARARPTAAANQQDLLFDSPKEEICIQSGDEDQLRRLVIILLDNAMKYTPAGGSIHLWCEVSQTRVVIHVRDNGRGIDPEKIPHIFERFYRIEDSAFGSPVPSGTGLGLAIAKQITSNHRGEIYAVSAPGEGAEFCVSLPCTLGPSCDGRHAVDDECIADMS